MPLQPTSRRSRRKSRFNPRFPLPAIESQSPLANCPRCQPKTAYEYVAPDALFYKGGT